MYPQPHDGVRAMSVQEHQDCGVQDMHGFLLREWQSVRDCKLEANNHYRTQTYG